MKKYVPLYILILLLGNCVNLKAQDPHLAQYYWANTFLNPANIGNFTGKARLEGNYRNQWASITNPFSTMHTSADFSIDRIGFGLNFIRDGVGDAGLTHINALIGLSYRQKIGPGKLGIGVQGGFIQKSFDPLNLSFDSQYDPDIGFNPNASNGEAFLSTKLTVGDLNVGATYDIKSEEPRTLMGLHVGVAYAHLNAPNLSFLDGDASLPSKLVGDLSLTIMGGERLLFIPHVLYMRQGTFQEILAGAKIDYEIDPEVFFHIGAQYRLGDAVIPMVGLSFNSMRLGISYDVNISELSEFSNLRGGMELSLGYIWGGQTGVKSNYKARKTSMLKDRDQDGIKDNRDRCPDIPGVKRFGGCPDSDGDGIVDSEDACPMSPGPKEQSGCPAMDQDGDGVMDKADHCPDLPGLIAYKGCPDTDSDGLPDHADKCPEDPGPRERGGCPASDIDADGDGIPDKIDICPTLAGVADLQGCPDADGDRIPDFEDLCPNIPGKKEFDGCPEAKKDADKDGILDEVDKCPTVAGLQKFEGCPDSDMDGIMDFDDKCPLTAGTKANQGCPDTNFDVDGDGVLNHLDKCPYVPGLQVYHGCPDTDKDGVSDLEDACPLIYGPANNRGCPYQNVQQQPMMQPPVIQQQPQVIYQQMPVQQQPQVIYQQVPPVQMQTQPGYVVTPQPQKGTTGSDFPKFDPVEFDTDQAIIKPHYYSLLNELADYLINNPSIKLLLAGHTDNEGDQMYNMVLGQNRSKAVKYYLTIRGVEESRISILSFGEIMPKVENNTTDSKARNRRTDFMLSY